MTSPFLHRSLAMLPADREPSVTVEELVDAIDGRPEPFRALLPVGYEAGVAAYRKAAASLTAHDLANHYTTGLDWFHTTFVPALVTRIEGLTGNAWSLKGWVAVAAGADTDLMSHLIDGIAMSAPVALYPGDWYGFRVGCHHTDRIAFDATGKAALAALCVPSVRDGRVTGDMGAFLSAADACLLNLNLFPTLPAEERKTVAQALAPLLPKSVLSISFSRGFGLTASQLGVALLPPDHPYLTRFATSWAWSTYFHNALAARAFLHLDETERQAVDLRRRVWVDAWLRERGLPVMQGGSYYVRSFRLSDAEQGIPEAIAPLVRGDVARLCMKPPQT